MNLNTLIKSIANHNGWYYRPYDPRDIELFAGVPPIPLGSWDYILAHHKVPQKKRFSSLGGGGAFVKNVNTAGIVEIAFLQGSIHVAAIEVLEAVGVSIPLTCVDRGSGGTSGFFAMSSQRIETPEWRRSLRAGLTIFTFECHTLKLDFGLQLPEED